MNEIRENLNKLDAQNLKNSDLLYEVLSGMITELEQIQGKLAIIEKKLDLK